MRISYKLGVQDAEGESTKKGLKALGFREVEGVRISKVYRIEGSYSKKDVEEMCRRLLANPVSQDYSIQEVKQ